MNKTGVTKKVIKDGIYLYQNTHNQNKYLEIHVYKTDCHYYIRNMFIYDNALMKEAKLRRIKRNSLLNILLQYKPIDFNTLSCYNKDIK